MALGKPSGAGMLQAVIVVIGVGLAVIGVRFWLQPQQAATFFGTGQVTVGGAYPTAWHDVVALRDVWLGLLAAALGMLKEWRALALWFGLGTLVCFADAGIATMAGAKPLSIGFHMGAGVLMAVVAVAAWRVSGRRSAIHCPGQNSHGGRSDRRSATG